jgi:hypothetical protein
MECVAPPQPSFNERTLHEKRDVFRDRARPEGSASSRVPRRRTAPDAAVGELPALIIAFHLIDPTAPLGYIVVPVLLGGLLPAVARTLPGRLEVTTRFSACHLVGTLDDTMESLGYVAAERGPGTVRYRTRPARWPKRHGEDITVTVRDHLLEVTGPVRTLRALRRQLSC